MPPKEVDDWQPVGQKKEVDDWAPVTQRPAPLPDARETQSLDIPQPFLDRVQQGQALDEALKHKQTGLEKLFGVNGPRFQLWPERLVRSGFTAGHDVTFGEVLTGPGLRKEDFSDDPNAPEPLDELIQRAGDMGAFQLGTTAFKPTLPRPLVNMRDGTVARPYTDVDGTARAQIVGRLPVEQDFKNAAANIGGITIKDATGTVHAPPGKVEQGIPATRDTAPPVGATQATPENAPAETLEGLLHQLWQKEGIHPAEAAHDAANDAFVKHNLTAEPRNTFSLEETFDYDKVLRGEKSADIPLRPLGAEVTQPSLVSPLKQPLSPPGRLAGAVHDLGEKLNDMGRDIQMKVAPMSVGTGETMAIAKDFSNLQRKNRWDWTRYDDATVKEFNAEQRKRMFNAMDEESVALQKGESREHQGLATLTPEERAAVIEKDQRQQAAWLKAQDLGIVSGDGIPMHAPRGLINIANPSKEGGMFALDPVGMNIRTGTPFLKHRKYLTVEETETAARAKFGPQAAVARDIRVVDMSTAQLEDAIAGRTFMNNIKEYGASTGKDTVVEGALPAGSKQNEWFTIPQNSAFWTWKPKLQKVETAEGITKFEAVKDEAGQTIFERTPIFVHKDFEGPLRAVMTEPNGAIYSGIMSLKGKTMSLIMNSPLIHNAVELGRAFPAMPTRVIGAYFKGFRAKHNVELMHEAIDNGLVPIGKRFFNQDVTSLMETPDLTPGRSWTAKALGETIGRLPQKGMTTEEVMAQVKRDVDTAGDFWHNTLLWDRIADLQMGLYTNFHNDLMAKGVDRQTASRVAAHLANRYAGALPQEAMSNGARKIANFMMFSRTFTVGNIGVMKDALTGLPKDVMAQIERDVGKADPSAVGYAKALARRKAVGVVLMDIGLLYVANSLMQNAANMLLMDSSLDEELHGYVRRYQDMMNETATHPMSLVTPLSIAGAALGTIGGVGGAIGGAVAGAGLSKVRKLSATAENEPGKQERIKIGYSKDGTAIYARSPFGKIGEEYVGYLESPRDMALRKEGTIMRPLMQTIANDKGFGRKIFDPNAETAAERLGLIWSIVEHFGKAQTPEGQVRAGWDFVKGDGDPKVNLLQALGPLGGVTFSKGSPYGPAVGQYQFDKARTDFQFQMEYPEIRKMIQRGESAAAIQRMNQLSVDKNFQNWIVRNVNDPQMRQNARSIQRYYSTRPPEERERFERLRQTGPMAPQQ